MTAAHERRPASTASAASVPAVGRAVYDVLGLRVGVTAADPEAIVLIDRSYGALRSDDGGPVDEGVALELAEHGHAVIRASDGSTFLSAAGLAAHLELLHLLVVRIMAALLRRQLYAIHAAAVARDGRALIVAASGGTGKTTMGLALAARGFEILSDELAILDPAGPSVLPYRRNVHVRPGTPELVQGLGALADRPREPLGGGIAWAVPQHELGASDDSGPRALAGIVLLDARRPEARLPTLHPVRPSLCALELLRGTWSASVDFDATLRALAAAAASVPCVRLAPADPMPSAELIASWFETTDA